MAEEDREGDFELGAASDDAAIQNFLDIQWRAGIAAAREGMEALRRLWPEMVEHVPETGSNHLSRALHSFEDAYRSLHSAGKHVIGSPEYDAYVAAQTERRISS